MSILSLPYGFKGFLITEEYYVISKMHKRILSTYEYTAYHNKERREDPIVLFDTLSPKKDHVVIVLWTDKEISAEGIWLSEVSKIIHYGENIDLSALQMIPCEIHEKRRTEEEIIRAKYMYLVYPLGVVCGDTIPCGITGISMNLVEFEHVEMSESYTDYEYLFPIEMLLQKPRQWHLNLYDSAGYITPDTYLEITGAIPDVSKIREINGPNAIPIIVFYYAININDRIAMFGTSEYNRPPPPIYQLPNEIEFNTFIPKQTRVILQYSKEAQNPDYGATIFNSLDEPKKRFPVSFLALKKQSKIDAEKKRISDLKKKNKK